MADTELRKRNVASTTDTDKPVEAVENVKPGYRRDSDDDNDYSPWPDVFRVLSFLLVASCGLSYLVSGGESLLWGFKDKPNLLRVDWWKARINGPLYLTDKELLAYSGQDPDKPLYLAINGTIYDVSNGRRMYGPGGSYSSFAGRDASRGFVTGCFSEDLTADLRGVEDMYLPIDDPQVDKYWTTAEMETLRAEEMANAKRRVHDALKHWVDFFANSKKYTRVGYVKREAEWLKKLPRRQLCAQAQKGRSKRKRNS